MSASPGEEDPGSSLISGLGAAMSALPEMTEKKRSIDMHTNIAMALMSEIKARELDKYYEMEDQFASQSVATSIKAMEELMSESQKGTLLDKTRALMCLYLSSRQLNRPNCRVSSKPWRVLVETLMVWLTCSI